MWVGAMWAAAADVAVFTTLVTLDVAVSGPVVIACFWTRTIWGAMITAGVVPVGVTGGTGNWLGIFGVWRGMGT